MAALSLAVVYAGLSKLLDLETTFGDSAGAAVVWPAAGVTVAVFLLRPGREWPAYTVAILVAETVINVTDGRSAWVSIGFGAAHAIVPLVAALLVSRRLDGVPDISRRRDLWVFLVAGAFAGPLVGAVIGSVWPWLLGEASIWPGLGRSYLGDVVGVLLVAPVILSIARPPAHSRFDLSQSWTFGVLAAALAFALPWPWSDDLGLTFVLIPVLALIGMRTGTRAAAGAVLAVGALVETLTALGHGPFAAGDGFGGILVVQTFLATCAVSCLTAAALMTDLLRRDDLALRDSLTGLANRRLLLDRLAQARRRIARSPAPIGLIYADLDGFKQINDVHGHAAGDQVLITTAARLRSVVRGSDTVARLGGDEFVILLDEPATETVLEHLTGRIRHAIMKPVILDEGSTVNVGVSIGYAVSSEPAEDSEELLDRADRAMYRRKRSRSSIPRPARGAPHGPAPAVAVDAGRRVA